ncbi:hypothetical protein [Xanthomonas maliensis]|uniref:hypothetical protein n=1 Tax=Xanthomonas maliensis TaxID=1321368 RepID=UPI0003B5BE9C|nr:hypothetical protein [Xanthomonas maliensis]KAB7764187.1 hypothetical protein CKY51_18155 [Xanthomonas maliensis]
MSGGLHPANAQLQVLADAHQRGQLDRAQYRARRRDVLQAARHAQGAVTQRSPRAPTAAKPGSLGRGTLVRSWRWWGTVIVLTVITLAFVLLIFTKGTPGLDRRSGSGELHGSAGHLTQLRTAAGQVVHPQQRMVLGDKL